MKKLGLIGGTSWRSTAEYYARINKSVNRKFGDNTNPSLRIASLNQKRIHDLQRTNDWNAIAEIIIEAALELQKINVEAVSLCAISPHKMFRGIQASLDIPILHIADALGDKIKQCGYDKVGLVGTRFTMEDPFLKARLRDRYQVETLIPSSKEIDEIQARIYDDISMGFFEETTKNFFLQVIESLEEKDAPAVILGCTELPLLLQDLSPSIPLVDSLQCHCEAIVNYMFDK